MKNKSAIAAYRAKNKITLEGLASKLTPPVDKSTILRWERGTVLFPVSRFDDMERVTGISRQELRPDIFRGMKLSPIK